VFEIFTPVVLQLAPQLLSRHQSNLFDGIAIGQEAFIGLLQVDKPRVGSVLVGWSVGVGANERGGGRTQDLHKIEQAHLSTWMHATQQRSERCSLHAPAHMMRNNNLKQLLPLAYAAAPQSRGVRKKLGPAA
jgi:hypothetical protein